MFPRGTQISWEGIIFYNFILNVKRINIINPSHASQKRTGQRSYCHAMASSWAIKHFDFHKLATRMLWFIDLMWPRVFRRSNVGLVQGYLSNFKATSAKKIDDLAPIWEFPDDNSNLNSWVAMKWHT